MKGQEQAGSTSNIVQPLEIAIVVKNHQTREVIARMIADSGYVPVTVDSLEDVLGLLSCDAIPLVILDADLCGGYYLEAIEKIHCVCPLTAVALLVGWWDERIREIFGKHKNFVYTPLRAWQVQGLLKRVLSQALVFPNVVA